MLIDEGAMQITCTAPSVAVEARKRLSIKHIELNPVDAGVVGACGDSQRNCSGEVPHVPR